MAANECDGTAEGVARVVAPHYTAGRWLRTDGGFMRFDGAVWVNDGDGIKLRSMIKREVRPLFAGREGLHEALGCSHFLDDVVRAVREAIPQAILDTDPGLIAFTNGVWDLRLGAFRPATPEDLLSASTGYPFVPEKNEAVAAEVAAYVDSVHPDPVQRARVLRMFAAQLHGGPGPVHVHVDSGKTLFFRALRYALGAYMVRFTAGMLTARRWPDTSKPSPMLSLWRPCRILYSDDLETRDKLNPGIIAKLTSGEDIQYRMLYDTPRSFTPMFKLHLICQPNARAIASAGPLAHRIDYPARFDTAAPGLDEWITRPDVSMELFRLLIDHL